MLTQTRWREVDEFEPWNPTQKAVEHYTGLPGGYSTFYYNHEPNITHLYGPDLGVAEIDEVPEAYGTIPGVYGPDIGVAGGANFAVAEVRGHAMGSVNIDEVPEAYGTIPGVYGPQLGMETVKVVPDAYGREPGIYDRKEHLEVLLSGAMGLGADGTPMSTGKKVAWLAGALTVGAAAGWIACSMLKG